MDHHKLWVEAFKFTPENFKQWLQEVPTDKTLVRWILETSKVSSETFLNWARKHYQLPTLKENFSEFVKASEIKNRYSDIWPDHVCPIGEWDGILFLACLEPVEEFKAPQQHQWVLASLPMIMKLRDEDMVPISSSVPILVPILDQAPAGLKLDLDPSKINFGDLSIGGPVGIHKDKIPDPPAVDAPAGLNFSLEAKSNDAPVGLSFDNISLEREPVSTSIVIPAIPISSPEIIKTAPVNLPPIPGTSEMPRPPAPGINRTPPPVPPPQEINSAYKMAQSSGQNSPMAEKEIRHFDDVGAYLLTELAKHFEKSMVLLFSKNRLSPWKHSEGWIRDGNKSPVIDLSSPSIFRIVNETKTSYHGRIVPNAINDSFFGTWNQGKYPEHITIAPVCISKDLVGMILGACSKVKGNSLNLAQIEQIGTQAGELLVKWGLSKVA